MTRPAPFDSPFLLGFEHTRALIERAAKAAAESYPPYNVEAIDENRVRITLAVAGFTPAQLAVTVEGNQLTVRGERDAEDRAFLHRGIAARGFTRAFVLADGMEVEAATLEHGLLHVDVARPDAARAVKQIPIRVAG
ncbi:Hsp20 family protein [Caulobacter sp. 17J65-9]|uniref:Hsp20 family protein n=1 Tax=Caulobacter sp. 17J65-9 TaxID=2709382 RepID=UPI0013C6AE6D|nr:Hsp20 family protein [Caulobacter sp. 17J65-9]NEX93072.1 Hsp20 family protein [Caulobacter sp. 17J65-9]